MRFQMLVLYLGCWHTLYWLSLLSPCADKAGRGRRILGAGALAAGGLEDARAALA